ncbi:26S proteasome regulatory subunit 6B homolog [Linum perenne]
MVTIRTVSLPLIFLQIDLWHLPSAPYGIILHRRCTSSPSVIVTDRRQKRLVFQVCTTKMNPSEEADLEDYVSRPDKISAAEMIKKEIVQTAKESMMQHDIKSKVYGKMEEAFVEMVNKELDELISRIKLQDGNT